MAAYILTLDGQEHRAEIEDLGSDNFRITLDGVAYHVDSCRLTETLRTLIIDNEVIEADIQDVNGHLSVLLRGETYEIQALDERRKRLRRAAAKSVSGGDIVTPMPGKIVKILAPVGTRVKVGQGVIVLEAMKMENEMSSTIDGVVTKIHVTEGQAVDKRALLATVSSDDD